MNELLVLICEAIAVYFLVLWAHSLRGKLGLADLPALVKFAVRHGLTPLD